MSILINGMVMPENCYECPFGDNEFYECAATKGRMSYHRDEYGYPDGERKDWCPLVPVPPHGRLIDADALKAHYSWWAGGTEEHTLDEMKRLFDTIIDLQPTIADGEVDHKVVAWMKLPDPYQEAKHYPTKKEHKTKDYEGTQRTWLVEARKNNKLTQAVTAKLIGVTQEAYSMYERGVRIPRPLVAKRIADVLGINWTWFYDRAEEVAGDG